MHAQFLSARIHYLQQLALRYGNIAVPFVAQKQTVPLHTIFQPLTLISDPLILQPQTSNTPFSILADEATKQITVLDGQQALNHSPQGRMVVLGGPGMGKTTVLKDLLHHTIEQALADMDAPLPIFISLPDLARSHQTLFNYLHTIVRELTGDTTFAPALQHAIEQGQAFICLDSLDEVLPALRPDIISLINDITTQYGGTWIIGSRFTEYKGGQFSHSQFAEWELRPLTNEVQDQFARHLLPTLHSIFHNDQSPPPDQQAETFISALRHDRQTHSWAQTPLLLSLAAVVYVQNGMLPNRRAQLYANAIGLMLRTRITDVALRDELYELLARLSLQLYQTHGRNFSLSELQTLLPTSLQTTELSTQYVLLQYLLDSGVFETVAYQTYGFKHQTFQEYLVAVALARQLCSDNDHECQNAWDFIWNKHLFSRWNEILRLLVGVLTHDYGAKGAQITARWLKRLAQQATEPDGDPGHLCLLLALSSLREFSTHVDDPELAEQLSWLLVQWADEYFPSPNSFRADVRRQRSNIYRSNFYRGALSGIFTDILEVELSIATTAIQHLESSSQEYYRGNYPPIPGIINHCLPLELIQTAFPDRPNMLLGEYYRAYNWQDEAILQRILALYQQRPSMQEAILATLGYIKLPASVDFLQTFTTQQDFSFRTKVVESLYLLEDITPLTTFYALLDDPESAIREYALKAVSRRAPHARIEEMIAKASLDNHPWLYDTIIEIATLHDILPPTGIIVEAIKSNDDDSMYNCISALFQHFKATIPIAPFLPLLRDKNHDASELATEALLIVQDRVASESWLDALLHAQNTFVHKKSVEIIAQRDFPLAIDTLLQLLSIGAALPLVRQRFAAHTSAIPLQRLLQMLDDPHHPTHNEASVLELIADRVPLEPILTALHRSDVQRKPAAFQALISILLQHNIQPSSADIKAAIQHSDLPYQVHEQYAQLLLFLFQQKISLDLPTVIHTAEHSYSNRKNIALALLRQFDPLTATRNLLRSAYTQLIAYRARPYVLSQIVHHFYEQITPAMLLDTIGNTIADRYLALRLLMVVDKLPIPWLLATFQDEHQTPNLRTIALFFLTRLHIRLPLTQIIDADDWFVETHPPRPEETIDSANVLSQAILDLSPNEQQAALQTLLIHLRATQSNFSVEALKRLSHLLPQAAITDLLTDPVAEIQQCGVKIASSLGSRVPIQQLIDMLASSTVSTQVKTEILTTLAVLAAYTPIAPFLSAINNADQDIRLRACIELNDWLQETRYPLPVSLILNLIDDNSSNPPLIHRLLNIIFTCVQQGQEVPEEPLITLLKTSNISNVRVRAFEILCLMPEKISVPQLLSLVNFNRQEDWPIFEALGLLGDRVPMEFLLDHIFDGMIVNEPHPVLTTLAKKTPALILALAHNHTKTGIRQAWQIALQTLIETDQDISMYAFATLDALNDGMESVYQEAIKTVGMAPHLFSAQSLLPFLSPEQSIKTRLVTLQALASFGPSASLASLLPLLAETELAETTLETLRLTHHELLQELVPQAEAIVRGEPLPAPFTARTHYRIASATQNIGKATPPVLDMLIDLLDYPQWDVQEQAARALGVLKRNIPDRGIRTLMRLRHSATTTIVQQVADYALGEILSVEQGIEDE